MTTKASTFTAHRPCAPETRGICATYIGDRCEWIGRLQVKTDEDRGFRYFTVRADSKAEAIAKAEKKAASIIARNAH